MAEVEIKYDITNKEQQERLKEAQSWFSSALRSLTVKYDSLIEKIDTVVILKTYYDVRKLSEEQKVELNKEINLLNRKRVKCLKDGYDSHGHRKLFSSIKCNYELSKQEKSFKEFVKNLDVKLVSAKTRDDKIESYVFNKEYTPEN